MARVRAQGDEGASLVEVLVSVVILGIGVVGLMSGLGFAFTATTRHRQLADANVLAQRAMEIAADPTLAPWQPCASAAASYQTVIQGQSGLSAVAVVDVKEWVGSGWQACGGSASLPLQLVTVSAPSPDGSSTVVMSIVKRNQP